MSDRRRSVAGGLFCLGWLGGLGLAFKGAATAIGTGPEHLIGLISASYLAAWAPYFLLSGRSPIGRAARFLAFSASLALGLMAFELPASVGLIDYRAVFRTPTPAWRRPENVPDADLIYARRGHRRERLRFVGVDYPRIDARSATIYHCDFLTDRDGFRNPVDLDRADVVVVGDSLVEGVQVGVDEVLTGRLSARLGRPVANLGRAGYGPQQELHVLRRFGVPLRPRACIWAFYEGNDLLDLAAYDAERARVRDARPESPRRAWYSRSLTRNALGWLVREYLRPEATEDSRLQVGRLVDRSGGTSPVYFSSGDHQGGPARLRPRPDSQELRRFRSILAEAKAECDRAGIDLIVAFIPTKFRVYRDLCTFDDDSPCRSWPLDDLPTALGEAVASASPGIGFLDLTPRLRDEAARGVRPYLADDTHWSAEGHRSAAEALGDLLEARRREWAEDGLARAGSGG